MQLTEYTLYETRDAFWVVRRNSEDGTYLVLKIAFAHETSDREPRFVLTELNQKFSEEKMQQWIQRLSDEEGLRRKSKAANGLLGVIRFTGCYYLALITKCSLVSLLGGNKIYHVDETELVPLVHSSEYELPDRRSIEGRLIATFHSLDLGRTFYFSETYDLTNTLQHNLNKLDTVETPPAPDPEPVEPVEPVPVLMTEPKEGVLDTDSDALDELVPPELAVPTTPPRASTPLASTPKSSSARENCANTDKISMFVWNSHLLSPLSESGPFLIESKLKSRWFLNVIHGFIDQARISVFGNHVTITIIARRSCHFAGVRFYKRGLNNEGYPANEVETEQIVSNELASQFSSRYTSYVQHRGSICVNWSQTSNNMSPQPPIKLDQTDPFYTSAAKHFDRMLSRYGYPIRVLNLVKTKEKRPRESVVSKEFETCIQYLNQFLPQDRNQITRNVETRMFSSIPQAVHRNQQKRKGLLLEGGCIEYTHWDMSRAAKSQSSEVMDYLGKYANSTLKVTSIFQPGISSQNGVCRTNCIDCLDRTNAAQTVIAKYALGYQLCALGIIDKPKVEYDTDVIDLLTEMYHDHGDTIALQYGGSNLVNTVETYRRINHWSSHSRDLIESVKRYYTNSFVDAQRQDAINVFLGRYQYVDGLNLWDLHTDYYLHNPTPRLEDVMRRGYCQWYEPRHLLPPSKPRFVNTVLKPEVECKNLVSLTDLFTSKVNSIDKYSQSVSPFEVHAKKRLRRVDSETKTSLQNLKIEAVPRVASSDETATVYTRYLQAPKAALATDIQASPDYMYREYFMPVTGSVSAYSLPDPDWETSLQPRVDKECQIYVEYAKLPL